MTNFLRFLKPFFSMLATGLLLIVFAISIGYATFIENDYGTTTARILIYNAWWFEVLLVLLAVNLVGSIIVNRLISRKKWAIFLFHAAFLVILAGAAITRYASFEGTLHIREGEQSNQLITETTFVKIVATQDDQTVVVSEEVKFSPYAANHFRKTFTIGDQQVTVENLQFVPSAAETVVEDLSGEPILALLAVDRQGRRNDFLLRTGENKWIDGIGFNFGTSADSALLSIRDVDGQLVFSCRDTVALVGMGDSEMQFLTPGEEHPLREKTVYQSGGVGFVLKQYFQKGRPQLIYVPSHSQAMPNDAFHARLSAGNETRDLFVYGKPGVIGQPTTADLGDLSVQVSYGSEVHELPFMLKLNDFQLERYPGSNSPSSYASEVTLIDQAHGVEKPYRIFMNNILKYRGYRFFQSSFDQDEQGTVLAVNFDSAGTAVTYIGYLLLAIGMVMTLFSRNSRFKRLARASVKLHEERKKLFAPILLFGLLLTSLTVAGQTTPVAYPAGHAREFARLQVQNNQGRIEPVNTLASEVLRKVYKKSSYQGLSPVQVLLGMTAEPESWKNIPIIKVGNSELRKILGTSADYVSFNSLLSDGTYQLRQWVEEAYEKEPVKRNKFDKEVINLDERVNILFKVFNGGFLTVFPLPGDSNNKWVAASETAVFTNKEVGLFASTVMHQYLTALKEARQTGDYTPADAALKQIRENQQKHGAAILPAGFKTSLEIFYVNFNIFSLLAKIYVAVGLLLLILQLAVLFRPQRNGKLASGVGFWTVVVLFAVHTAGLGIRWYISGHAPWSNGYETLIYISWAVCLSGLIFARRSPMTLAVTTVLSAITLFVAGMSWMNPELTNLVPVLKSYWLVVHVAIITASYGFLAMGALLGLVNLVLMIMRTSQNSARINFTIKELVLIIEMAIIIGLFMLTLGAFIGGVWANESWGRYWGWDPKETWALVTVLVYAFITHMHKIPGFRGSFAVSTAALLGFSSVLMTFFGVNYYLSGLHSYAQGEPAPVPSGVYIAVVLVFAIVISAFIAERHSGKAGELPEELPED